MRQRFEERGRCVNAGQEPELPLGHRLDGDESRHGPSAAGDDNVAAEFDARKQF